MTRARDLADLISSGKIEVGELADNTITRAKLANNVIDSAQVNDGAIDLAHMSANSVDSTQYVDGSIDLAHMSANSVDSDQYVDGSIDTAHIANNAITAVKIDSAVELGGPSLGTSSILRTNDQSIGENVTVPATGTTGNAMTIGPVSIGSNYTVSIAGIWNII
jgi:hypothetical protein